LKHTVKQELAGVLAFIGIIWASFLLDAVLPATLTSWGVVPRTLWGLIGIPLAPFLHLDLAHLLSNTVPLLILLILLAGSRTESWSTVAEIIVIGGLLLWLFGRFQTHAGASGLIYGLITFLITAGILEKRLVPLFVALVVGFLYGGTLLSGVLPSVGPKVSWDGHLLGAVAGVVVAYLNVGRKSIDAAPASKEA
jgi:membrane associated rhomboid family serine protease